MGKLTPAERERLALEAARRGEVAKFHGDGTVTYEPLATYRPPRQAEPVVLTAPPRTDCTRCGE